MTTAENLHAPEPARAKTPIWFWIVAVLAVIWNGFGMVDYVMTQTQNEAYLASFTEEQLALFMGYPAWFTAIWALAVTTAFLGSLALLFRTKWAVWLFAVSVVCYIVSCVYNFGFAGAMDVMGMAGLIMSAVIGVVLLLLLWMSLAMKKRGVLR